MDSTGEILRRARNDRHLTLDEVATRTRINRKYLTAIESGDSSAIPGGFFYKSFVRQYASALSTEDDNVLDRIEQSLAAEQPVSPPPPDDEVLKAWAIKAEENVGPSSSSSRSAAAYAFLLVLAMAGATGVYMIWHRAQQAQAADDTSRSTPRVAKKQETPPAYTSVAQPQSQAQEPAGAKQPEPSTLAGQAPASANQVPAKATEATTAAPSSDDKIALNLSAKDQTWISVSADGKTLFSGILEAGQSRTFTAKANARMRLGNAGGIDLRFNGNPTGALGSSGQPVTILFTPSSFEIVKPKPDE